jgi:hypothetical protein
MRPNAVAAVSASSGWLIGRSGYTGQQPAPDGIIDHMSWASVSPTVLPLAGVIVGAGSTLLGQHLAVRRDARREAAQRAADQRAERKDAIIGFLSATERVEQHRGQHASELSLDEAAMIELMHAVWLAKKIIELVCSGTLAQAAQDYTLVLNQASQELGPRGAGRRSPAMSSRTFLDKLIFAVFALVSIGAWGWAAYYPCQRLGAYR